MNPTNDRYVEMLEQKNVDLIIKYEKEIADRNKTITTLVDQLKYIHTDMVFLKRIRKLHIEQLAVMGKASEGMDERLNIMKAIIANQETIIETNRQLIEHQDAHLKDFLEKKEMNAKRAGHLLMMRHNDQEEIRELKKLLLEGSNVITHLVDERLARDSRATKYVSSVMKRLKE